ncbi:hypothetical protein CK203_047616 [Vitis vinifera]|uniref:Uncharacterized protein n=1 Tax=Vitis vinifera TaxID=29760 RepID=A0A438H5N2_VITVI|nr:hypothetical protein CK203_047616 [Vitis vinifera]
MMQQSSQILHLPRNGELGSLFSCFLKKGKDAKALKEELLDAIAHLIEVLMPLLRISKRLIRAKSNALALMSKERN